MVNIPEIANDLIYPDGDPNLVSMDDALEKAFKAHGLERLGGASGRGWSYYSAIQRCPYLFQRRYRTKQKISEGRKSRALETGSAVHALLAVHYECVRGAIPMTPIGLRDHLFEFEADPHVVAESWRLYEAYQATYEIDPLVPLGAEVLAVLPNGDSCRYDLIARVDEGHSLFPPGTYIVEHKTASRFDAAALDGWANDGEILGQTRIYQQGRLYRQYGQLRGVIVNLIGKQKIPQFDRRLVPASPRAIKKHESDLAFWRAQIAMHDAFGKWPRARAGCITRYGFCDMFEECGAGSL